MKRVSFEVAKALKEAGYPITGSSFCYNLDGELVEEWKPNKDYIDAPTYLEVWPWLWQEKDIKFLISEGTCVIRIHGIFQKYFAHSDNEEAVIAAIEYLVENNLIK